jgi:hypothetical protein
MLLEGLSWVGVKPQAISPNALNASLNPISRLQGEITISSTREER